MKRRLAALVGLGLGTWLIALVATVPAAWALALLEPHGVEPAGVSGTVWDGRAQLLALDRGPRLRSVEWEVVSWRLLTGRLAADVGLELAGARAEGRLARTLDGRVEAIGIAVRGGVEGLAGMVAERVGRSPPAALDGHLRARIDRAVVADDRLRTVAGRFEWSDAAITAPVEIALGTVRGRLAPADDSHRLRVDGSGGAVAIDGVVAIDADGGYRADLRLEPTPAAPPGLAELLADAAGQRGGGLSRDDGAFRLVRRGRL